MANLFLAESLLGTIPFTLIALNLILRFLRPCRGINPWTFSWRCKYILVCGEVVHIHSRHRITCTHGGRHVKVNKLMNK